MSEINHRYLKDNDGNRYFPVTHVDAIRGLESLIKTTGWKSVETLNGARTKSGYSEPLVKYDTIFGIKQVTLIFYLENLENGEEILEIPPEYVGDSPRVFNVVGSIYMFPNKIEVQDDGKVKFIVHKENNWSSTDYAYLEATWQL